MGGPQWLPMSPLSPEDVRKLVGMQMTDTEANALAAWYAPLRAALAAFPEADLRQVEPPLHSIPAPRPR